MSLRIQRALNQGMLAEDPGVISVDRDHLIFNIACRSGKDGAGILYGAVALDGGVMTFDHGEDAWISYVVVRHGTGNSLISLTAQMRGRETIVLDSLMTHNVDRLGGPEGPVISDIAMALSAMGSPGSGDFDLTAEPTQGQVMHALNDSSVEAYIWAELVRKARESCDVKKVILSVHMDQLLSTLSEPYRNKIENQPSIEVEFEPSSETPGVSLLAIMRNEYFDAIQSCDGSLTQKKTCGRARTSSCFGEGIPCTYDDYVISRAIGMCPSCHDEESARNKFNVD